MVLALGGSLLFTSWLGVLLEEEGDECFQACCFQNAPHLAVFNMPLGFDLFNVHKSDRKPYPPQTVREAEVREEVWV